MNFRPEDSASEPLPPRGLFMYLRLMASMCKLPVAIASPLLAMQKRLGRNRVREVVPKLHKPTVRASFTVIPFPLIDAGTEGAFDETSTDLKWVRQRLSHLISFLIS